MYAIMLRVEKKGDEKELSVELKSDCSTAEKNWAIER